MSVLQAAQQAVGDVAQNVVDTTKAAVTASAKQVAKTPLDILEELMGGAPADGGADSKPQEPLEGSQSSVDPALMQKQAQEDDVFKQQQHQELHNQITSQSQQYYEQKKEMEAQQKAADDQRKEQERFQIQQLEKQKKENFAVQTAKDAANAEKSRNVGAG